MTFPHGVQSMATPFTSVQGVPPLHATQPQLGSRARILAGTARIVGGTARIVGGTARAKRWPWSRFLMSLAMTFPHGLQCMATPFTGVQGVPPTFMLPEHGVLPGVPTQSCNFARDAGAS